MAALVDTTQLQAHVFALRASGPILMKSVEAVTKLAAQRVGMTARGAFVGTRYWTRVPPGITWDTHRKGPLVEAEIGQVRGSGGPSAMLHWLEYGTSRQGPIKPSLGPALDANEEPYERALLAAATAVMVAST